MPGSTSKGRQLFRWNYKTNADEAREAFENRDTKFLKQIEHEILTPWNETYDADSDEFWRLVELGAC